jgi:hypothetical protein
MKQLAQISLLLLMVCCKTKQTVIHNAAPSIRPQLEKRIPDKKGYKIVEAFFETWSDKSSGISKNEFSKLDSISKLGYGLFESLFSDSGFIGLKRDRINAKYILLPNQIRIGIADSVRKESGFVYFDSLNLITLNNFNPRISIAGKQVLYYTKDYQDTLPGFAEKYGVGGFIQVDSYLMSNYPRYLETPPIIREIIFLRKTGEYCIQYEDDSNLYQTLAKKANGKWVKIKDLTILASD